MFSDVSLIAVGLAAVASMAIGFAWYSPALFGNPWMKLRGITKKTMEDMKDEMQKIYGLSFVGGLVQTYVLAHYVGFFGADTIRDAVSVAFWPWLGFVAITQLSMMLYSGKKFNPQLFAIDTGYQLVSLIAMASVITIIG